MKKTVAVYGLITGAIVSVLMAITMMQMKKNPEQGGSMVIGYLTMLIAFTFIFIAIKSYRDKQLGGTISFGKAFVTGLWVAIIASVCYTITWAIIYKGFYPEFMDQMTGRELAALEKSGKSPVEIAEAKADMEKMTAFYNTWPGLIGWTLLEILPLGVLVTLVSSLILRRRPDHPAVAAQAG